MRWSLVLLAALGYLHSQASKPECCPKRRVGIHTYTLIEPATDHPIDMGGCLDNCAYRKRGDSEDADFDQIFCFERGNQSSACLGGTNLEQGTSAVSGYAIMENNVLCGDFWDFNAAKVVCKELGLGAPKEVFGGARFGVPVKEYHEMIPVCIGSEEKLDSCKLTKNSSPCSHPAGLVCSRITSSNGSTMLDGLPICADGFTDKEATAVCKEGGFFDGTVNSASSQDIEVPTGWTLSCKHENLDTCHKSVCVNGSSASFTCGNASEVKIFGGTIPGQGTVLYNGGLVCDDAWDIQDADVVCRELGYSGADNATTHSYFGPAETPLQAAQNIKIPYTADEVSCEGNETSLSKCDHIVKSNCDIGEAAGVMCTLEVNGTKTRNKRGAGALVAAAPAVSQLAQTGANIVGSAVDYFDRKEKEKQAYLKERPDQVDLSSAGVEIKMQHGKGYMDLGGEFQAGGMDLKIQDIPGHSPKPEDGGQAFTYPAGLGPMLMNGCFGTGYKEGDPCYAAKRLNTKCLDMMEAANYVGVGFDGTGAYNHAGRRKSLIQRSCAGKSTYQGEDVPDNMNVFGIYDSSCTGTSYESLEARSQAQREQAKMGENSDFLSYYDKAKLSVKVKRSFWTASIKVSGKYNSESQKQTGSSASSRATGKAAAKDSKTVSGIFDFSCRIRRYEIFLDEVKPDQLSEAFLQDYMALPIRYFDFRNKAPRKFTDFLLRWGTHYIKSASFGGKFTLLRQSTLSGEETKEEWQARQQESASAMFESKTSSKEFSASYGLFSSPKASASSEGQQNSESGASAAESSSSKDSSSRSESSLTMDDIIVEGGHQRVASILSDKNRAGFKGEFVSWLDSIPQYPKGYDFKFGEIADLLDINYRSLLKDFQPCWEIENKEPGKDDNGNDITTYKVTVKDENGDDKEEVRECRFNSIDDFQNQMDKKRLSLKYAVTLFAKNRGRSWNELTLPAGDVECEKKTFQTDEIRYPDLLDGSTYEVAFDLLYPIGDKILNNDIVLLRFAEAINSSKVKRGSWQVNEGQSRAAGQIGKVVFADENEMKVYIYGARFTYYSVGTRNYLKWTILDCKYNLRRFKNLKNIECTFFGDATDEDKHEDEDGDIDWVEVPLATVISLDPPTEYLPCNMEWSNHQMLMSDSSCVRFTAASEGPIYFGLSAVPDKLSTWYYFRITSDDVTVYKGNNILEASTDANGAVGLGNENLFQSYIICSEHGVEEDDTGKKTVSTKLTYGKIGADDTINKDAKLQSYLIVNDVEKEPIKPSFFAFGSGEFKVQIVDIEVTDLPPVECAGDTFDTGSGCQTSCRMDDLIAMSGQTNNLTCYDKSKKELKNSNRVPAGGYCEVSCADKEGKVPYPRDVRTTCKPNSEWTSAVRCSAKCSPSQVLERGLLSIHGEEVPKSIKNNVTCEDIDGVPLTSFDYILEGSTCYIGDQETNFCGLDEDKFEYYNSDQYRSLGCTEDGSWKTDDSTVPVTEPVCKAMPCPQMMEANVTSSVAVKCKKESKEATIINGFMNEEVVCELESCKPTHFIQNPSQTECADGNWTNSLKCSPRDATCTPADIPQIAHGTLDCTGNQMDGGNYLGGSECQLTCDAGYISNGVVQCINALASKGTKGKWSKHTCVKDERCDQDRLPSVTDGKIKCNEPGANRHHTRVQYVEAGTVCEIECNSGYEEISGDPSLVCKAKIWETTGSCLLQRCRIIDLNVDVAHGSVKCEEDGKVYRRGDTCPVECNTGYRHNNNNREIACGWYGVWTQSSSQCVRDGNWGSWGSWGSWSTCTRACGGGSQSRSRSRFCNNPAPDNGGKTCPGSSSNKHKVSQACNTQGCLVDGNWGSWGAWLTCSHTCGEGSQYRYRSCNNPAPANGGRQCLGGRVDSKYCNEQSCPCDSGWEEYGGWCYQFVHEKGNWYGAENKCKGRGGHLTSIHSAGENQFLNNLGIKKNVRHLVWNGLNDIPKEGVFRWTDGSSLLFTSWPSPQPDNHKGNQDCVIMGWGTSPLTSWDDVECDQPHANGFICKKKK